MGLWGSLAKSPPACLSLLCKAAFSPVEQCGDNAGRIPMLPASSCWQKHFFWFSQFPRMTVLTKLVVIEDWAYFEDQLLSGAPDTFFMKIRKFTETRPQLVIESPITQSDVRQRLKVVWHLYRLILWFCVIKDNISTNSFMLWKIGCPLLSNRKISTFPFHVIKSLLSCYPGKRHRHFIIGFYQVRYQVEQKKLFGATTVALYWTM